MIFFVILIYSERYYTQAIYEFDKIARSVSRNDCYKVIIINNNKNLKLDSFRKKNINFQFIDGDNEGFEFSGWDKATEYIKKNYLIENDFIVYANDTFCHHRKWNYLTKSKFISEFRKFIDDSRKGICGEVNTFNQYFLLKNQKIDSWISSYLFILSSNIISEKEFKFDNSSEFFSDWVSNINSEGVFFNTDFSVKLGIHINNWLFPKSGKGWYKAERATLQEKRNKLYSILNEKALTANIVKFGGGVYDVNDFLKINFFKKLKKVLKGSKKIEN